jgi:hypothetical protein
MTSPAHIIATNLAALPHPDGTPRQLPGFSMQLMPEHMAQQVTQTANELGEAIVYLLENSGYQIVSAAQIEQPATADDAPQIANVHCTYCDARVMQLNMTNPAKVLTMHHFTAQKCPQA